MFKSKWAHENIPTVFVRLGIALALLAAMLHFSPVTATDDAWSALGDGTDGDVYALAFDGSGNLFIGGSFTSAGGVAAKFVAKWDGSSWSALGSGMNNTVYALSFDNSGNLYAGGSFTTAGGVAASRIAKWDGAAWSSLGSGVGGTSAEVDALVFDDTGNLYAGGNFTTAGGASANRIAKWNGSVWSGLGDGMGGRVYALAFDNGGNLYVSGIFTSPYSRIAKWDGSSWFSLSGGTSNTIRAIVVDGSGHLYAGGSFATANGMTVNRVAEWDGTNWSALGSGVNADIYALALDGSGSLYAAGNFTSAGGIAAAYIARWDGGSWYPLGSGVDNASRALTFDSGEGLITGGSFLAAGGVTANHIAKWGTATPDDFNLTPSSVAENQPTGTVVGTFTPLNPGVGETYTYSLVAGIGSGDNASFNISGDALLTTETLDYETRNSYSVRVRSTSSSGSHYEKAFTISVTDVNEPPIIMEGASVLVSMDENSSPVPFNLTLHATDENTTTLVWSISSSATHGTASASGTGSSKSIGYIPQTDYTGSDSFVVMVRDNIGGEDTILVNVTINPATTTHLRPLTINSLFCTGESATVTISIANIENLFGYQFIASYDPGLVNTTGAFINTFFNTTTNTSIPSGWNAACSSGACKFAVSKMEPGTPVSGSGTLAQITLTGLNAGAFDIILTQDLLSNRDGGAISHEVSSLHMTVCGFANVTGVVTLQGRSTPVNSGLVTLTDLGGIFGPYIASFNPTSGVFTINGVRVMPDGSNYQFDATHGLYIGGRTTHMLNPLDNYAVPATRLLAGDANNDGMIDLSDLTCIGGSFGGAPVACGTTGTSDINADGAVNILDLVLIGGNYGLAVPRPW